MENIYGLPVEERKGAFLKSVAETKCNYNTEEAVKILNEHRNGHDYSNEIKLQEEIDLYHKCTLEFFKVLFRWKNSLSNEDINERFVSEVLSGVFDAAYNTLYLQENDYDEINEFRKEI